MKNQYRFPQLAIASVLLVLCASAAQAQTLADFGYDNMATPSTLTCLVVVVDYDDTTPIPENLAYWDSFVFNPAMQPHGVNAFFNEMSLGRFQLVRGETVMISQPASNRLAAVIDRMGAEDGNSWFHDNLAYEGMLAATDFEDYDIDGNGRVDESELLFLFIGEGMGGAQRGAGPVQPPGIGVEWSGAIARSALPTSFGKLGTMTHELSHLFGALDLYGIWGTDQDLNQDLTLMSGEKTHHDVWHKIQFGWVEPQIGILGAGGVATLHAPHTGRADAALILYDENVGTDEFFMLEYRTQSNAGGTTTPYDTNLPGNGLVIWHVYHNPATKKPVEYAGLVHPAAERDLYECECGALVQGYALGWLSCASTNATHMPAVGTLESPKDEHAIEYGTTGDPLETILRCKYCGCYYFAAYETVSDCPYNGGPHDDGGLSANYFIRRNVPGPVGHNNWRRCTKCQSLVYYPRLADSTCPEDGQPHTVADDQYTVIAHWAHWTVMARSAPDLLLGENQLWGSDTTTPLLTWYDGSSTATRVHVREFDEGDSSITVEWSTSVWVDFQYVGTELGTLDNPYNTVAEGVAAAQEGGTVFVRGQSPETPNIPKRVRIESYNGTGTIGQ